MVQHGIWRLDEGGLCDMIATSNKFRPIGAVVLFFGINNVCNAGEIQAFGSTLAIVSTCINYMVTRITAAMSCGSAQTIAVVAIPILPTWEPWRVRLARGINKRVRQFLKDQPTAVAVDFPKAMFGDPVRQKLLSDSTHLNRQGYERFAATLYTVLILKLDLPVSSTPTIAPTQPVHSVPSVGDGRGLVKLVMDIETGDPDDILTLLFALSHPRIQVRAVTVTPGSREQVALIRWILQEVLGAQHTVSVGAREWPKNAPKVLEGLRSKTGFYSLFGRARVGATDCEDATAVLVRECGPDTVLFTGGPLQNLGAALKDARFQLGVWLGQGGFAGEACAQAAGVALFEKFRGKDFCATWNFSGDIRSAELALRSPAIGRRVLVGKNICHRDDNRYSRALHHKVRDAAAATADQAQEKALKLLYHCMDGYRSTKGKLLHDPLALSACINPSIFKFIEAKVKYSPQKRGWGSFPQKGTGTQVAVDFSPARFVETMLSVTATPASHSIASCVPGVAVAEGFIAAKHDGRTDEQVAPQTLVSQKNSVFASEESASILTPPPMPELTKNSSYWFGAGASQSISRDVRPEESLTTNGVDADADAIAGGDSAVAVGGDSAVADATGGAKDTFGEPADDMSKLDIDGCRAELLATLKQNPFDAKVGVCHRDI